MGDDIEAYRDETCTHKLTVSHTAPAPRKPVRRILPKSAESGLHRRFAVTGGLGEDGAGGRSKQHDDYNKIMISRRLKALCSISDERVRWDSAPNESLKAMN